MRCDPGWQDFATPTGSRSMPSAFAFSTSAASSGAFSIMWPNGSPGATSPSKVRKVGRTASCRRLSVITMSRIGCAPAGNRVPDADRLEQPARRRHDRGRTRVRRSRASAGSATATENDGPSACRSAIASARPAKPAPPISTSMGRAPVSLLHGRLPDEPQLYHRAAFCEPRRMWQKGAQCPRPSKTC